MIFRERYRDLILAADTIGKMKITSEKVTARIANVEDKFRELQKKYLIGFKTEPIEDKLDKYSFSNITCTYYLNAELGNNALLCVMMLFFSLTN